MDKLGKQASKRVGLSLAASGRFPASLVGDRADMHTQPRSISPGALLEAFQRLAGQTNEDFRQRLAMLARDLLSCIALTAEQLPKKKRPREMVQRVLSLHSPLQSWVTSARSESSSRAP